MKDTFYFSHDYNTRQDVKIKKLIQKHGMCGYGIFWAIIEDLYNNANALPLDYETIAFDLRSSENIIDSIINDFGLFIIEGNEFGSKSVEKRLEERNEKSTKARQSALKRWGEKNNDANALKSQSESNAIKESKVNESKVNESKKKKVKKENEIKIKSDFEIELETLFFVFNQYFNTNHSNIEPCKKNYAEWRKKYEPAQIEQSIINASKDQFWKDKLTPVILFRQKNQNKEDVDYIGSFLNKKIELTQKQEMGNAVKESLIFQLNKIKAQ